MGIFGIIKQKMGMAMRGIGGLDRAITSYGGVVMTLAVILLVLGAFASAMTADSAEQNATEDLIDDLVSAVPLIGVLILVVVGAVAIAYVTGIAGGRR